MNLSVVNTAELPTESWEDANRGSGTWRTVFSADRTHTMDLVCGLATFGPGTTLEPHHHAATELYYCLSGAATVMLGQELVTMFPGLAIFIPSNAVHGVTAGPEGVTFLYVFGANSFADIAYTFVGLPSEGNAPEHAAA